MNTSTKRISAREIANALELPLPTDEQVAVIEAPLEPALVVAGAGSGKTETMAGRLVWLIANDLVAPDQVLGLTFTRKAAGELSSRITRRLAALDQTGQKSEPNAKPAVATYNSFAASLVADHGLRLGVETGARLLSEADRWQLATEVVAAWDGELTVDRSLNSVVGAVLVLAAEMGEHLVAAESAHRWLTNAHTALTALPGVTLKGGKINEPTKDARNLIEKFAERREWLALVAEYERRKAELGALEYSDQVKLAVALADVHPDLGTLLQDQYRVVLLDEYQDTSYAQAQLLSTLFGDGHPVMAVGDPHQAIFGWRGASAGGLAHFPAAFPRRDQSPAKVLTLTTSWRNDANVLAAANTVAAQLRSESAVPVPELSLREKGDPGRVEAIVSETYAQEAEAVAEWIAARWQPTSAPDGLVTAAVLCRARSKFPALAAALTARGIPVEVVGLGGLLGTEEITDLVALLQAVADPGRGDALLRLLTGPRVNLGAADLFALGSWSRDLARRSRVVPPQPIASRFAGDPENEPVETTAAPAASDIVDQASLIEAIAHLPQPDQKTSDGRRLTAAGRERLTALARVIERLRAAAHLSLPELVAQAERELHLDVEAAVAGGGGRANLDAFRTVAANFASNSDQVTLAAFLAWLEVAQEKEGGLDQPLGEVNPDAVQLITVHGAKGLEWDVVAVPGLVEGGFPAVAPAFRRGEKALDWLSKPGALPSDLRGDAADLPRFEWDKAADTGDLLKRKQEFTEQMRAHQRTEERRLAYVAFTRAKKELLLSAYWWDESKQPRELAAFLTELAAAKLIDSTNWAPPPPDDALNPNIGEPETAWWPEPPTADASPNALVRASAAQVAAARRARAGGHVKPPVSFGESATPANYPPRLTAPRGVLVDPDGNDLVEVAELLLAERDSPREFDLRLPVGLSASALVRLADDRDEFARQLRRPVPTKPTAAAHRGTLFHEWAERYFRPDGVLFELADLDDAESDELDLSQLQAMFMASAWAARTPIAVEQRIYTQIGPSLITAQIDAVFPDPQRPGAVVVVDWKTGSPPRDAQSRRAREVQLAVYRLAWSKFSDTPIEQVDAAFHYVAAGETVRPERLMDAAEIAELITRTP